MSAKHYCDLCGDEIDRNYVSQRYIPWMFVTNERGGQNAAVELTVKVNGVWNQGDACLRCVLMVVNQGREV